MKRLRRFIALLSFALLLSALPFASLAKVVELPIDFSPGKPFEGKYEPSKKDYHDPSITVTRTSEKSAKYKCTYYRVIVKIANPTQIRTLSAGGFDSKRQATVEVMSKRVNAVAAVDGDFYSKHPGSFVLRQGKVYRDSVNDNSDVLLIDENGDFHIILAEENPGKMDLKQVNGKKVINGFEFGPALVKDGKRVLDISKSPNHSDPKQRAQRIAIAQIGELEYMIVGVAHFGATLEEFCSLVQELAPVQNAYMLDGGNSAQIVFMGRKINNTHVKNVRPVSDCIYFASAYEPDK